MPLYELEEGTSRKFYRIELVGTRVELCWGRIGTPGTKKVLDCKTPAAAKAEYDAQIAKRRERGYRLVVDESRPHDPAELRDRGLARTGALTEHPRYVFHHARRKQFVWIEVRGATTVIARGALGEEAGAAAEEVAHASPAAAERDRDRRMAALLGEGFVLESFGAKPSKASKPSRKVAKKQLISEPALEAAIVADPAWDAAWRALEDRLVERGDPRAAVIEHERARAAGEAAQARGALDALLFGIHANAIKRAMRRATWRAGFVTSCSFTVPEREAETIIDAWGRAPAMQLVSRVDVTGDPDQIQRLAGVAFAGCVRELDVAPMSATTAPLDLGFLAPFARLASLSIGSFRLDGYDPSLARLASLGIRVQAPTDLVALFSGPLPALQKLELGLGAYTGSVTDFVAPLAASAPALRDLRVTARDDAAARRLRAALAETDLPARLETLALA